MSECVHKNIAVVYREGVHLSGALTRPWCMRRRARLTVKVWRLLDHALYQLYPTGQDRLVVEEGRR